MEEKLNNSEIDVESIVIMEKLTGNNREFLIIDDFLECSNKTGINLLLSQACQVQENHHWHLIHFMLTAKGVMLKA